VSNPSQYWIYENELQDDVINKILTYKKQDWQQATIHAHKFEEIVDKKMRITDVIFCNEQWLFDLFWSYMTNANTQAEWNLDVDCAESFQLGRYGVGGHYDFHTDNLGFDIIKREGNITNGKTRKISMVLWLNEDFEGGEFEFYNGVPKKPTKGTILFFPSWIPHKVHPVTKGTRYSLVTWFCGKPLR
jgi:PKHD-type hydroxylase